MAIDNLTRLEKMIYRIIFYICFSTGWICVYLLSPRGNSSIGQPFLFTVLVIASIGSIISGSSYNKDIRFIELRRFSKKEDGINPDDWRAAKATYTQAEKVTNEESSSTDEYKRSDP